MNNIKYLRDDFNAGQAMIYEILNDTSSAVMDSKHPMHLEANTAFRKLEQHVQNLIDQIAKFQRKAA